MQPLMIYCLKLCAYSGLFFLYYIILLRNKRLHYYNRFYLLCSVGFSSLLPLLQLNIWQWNGANTHVTGLLNAIQLHSVGNAIQSPDNFISFEFIVLCFTIGIALFFISKLLFSILKIYKVARQYPSEWIDGIWLINTDLPEAPFSFFRYLFWKNTLDMRSETGQQIFKHEMAHIQQKHSCDKLFLRIVTAVCWFNPFFWWMQKELSLLHEFIADEQAIEDNNTEAFARMLLQSQYEKTIFSPAQSFSYSPIKRRLFMLTSSRKTSFSFARRIAVLPLLAASVFLFSFSVNDENQIVQDGFYAEQSIAIRQKDTLGKAPLYIIDGKEISGDFVKKIDANTIQSVNVIKDVEAIKKYGEKGKNGVVLITLNKANTRNDGANMVDSATPDAMAKAIYFVDGKEQNKEEVAQIPQQQIASVNVWKGEAAIKKYGVKGKNGVIEIIRKKD